MKVYLDDIRTPSGEDWIIVRNYNDFMSKIKEIGISNISLISLDHDLADEHYRISMYNPDEHYSNYYNDGTFKEKTGYDCAKFLVDFCLNNNLKLPQINVHSMNPIGSKNIITLINNFYKFSNINKNCTHVFIHNDSDKFLI